MKGNADCAIILATRGNPIPKGLFIMKFKRILSFACAVAMCAGMLTGCKNSDDSSAVTTTATTTSTTTTSTTTTVKTTTSQVDGDDPEVSTTASDDETTTSSVITTTTTASESSAPETTTKKPNTTTTKKPVVTTSATTTKKPVTTTTKKHDVKPPVTQNGEMRDMSTQEVIDDMGVGINLGNTFESCGSWINSSSVTNYETAWGSIQITEDIIAGYKAAGFGVIRVPVAWSNMMGSNYQINQKYIDRVKQVVDWIIENDMYAIINIHWDGGWINNYSDSGMSFSKTYDECMKKYTTMWETLCYEFGGYGDHLMFESLNEEGCWDDVWNRWGGTNGKSKAFGLLNGINQKFVDIVRASGGNNAKRHLLIAGYATDVDLTCDSMFKMPKDSAGRCAVSVHYYTPSTFCILTEDADWGKASSTWGSSSEIKALERYFDKLKTTFVDKGIPVIIGEYGCPHDNKDLESVRKFITTVSTEAIERGICPVLWDTFDKNNPTKCFYNRKTCKMNDSVIAKNFLELSK